MPEARTIPVAEISRNSMVVEWLYVQCTHAHSCKVEKIKEKGEPCLRFPEDCDTDCYERILNQYINMFGNR